MMRLFQLAVLVIGQLLGITAFAAWALATGFGLRTSAAVVALASILIAFAVSPAAESEDEVPDDRLKGGLHGK